MSCPSAPHTHGRPISLDARSTASRASASDARSRRHTGCTAYDSGNMGHLSRRGRLGVGFASRAEAKKRQIVAAVFIVFSAVCRSVARMRCRAAETVLVSSSSSWRNRRLVNQREYPRQSATLPDLESAKLTRLGPPSVQHERHRARMLRTA